MLETDKLENAVKDLLKEHSARQMLYSLNKKKKSRMLFLMSLAAIFVLGIFYVTFGIFSTSSVDRFALASNSYEFPSVAKSRSAEINIVDAYLADLDAKKYKSVLSHLDEPVLSEKDLFVKANIYYTLDSLDKSLYIIENTQWEDELNKAEIDYLHFLIQFRKGAGSEKLIALSKTLDENYKKMAEELILKLGR